MANLRGKKKQVAMKLRKLKDQKKKIDDEIKLLSDSLKNELDFGSYGCGDFSVDLVEIEKEQFYKEKAKKLLTKAQWKKCVSTTFVPTLYIKNLD